MMGEDSCYLITLIYGELLVRCALKTDLELKCPMTPKNKKKLHALLPLHVRTLGPIAEVEEIFEIKDLSKGGNGE